MDLITRLRIAMEAHQSLLSDLMAKADAHDSISADLAKAKADLTDMTKKYETVLEEMAQFFESTNAAGSQSATLPAAATTALAPTALTAPAAA
ncbi:hypothetical protein OGR47_02720 [Methylocystis sp. MJC1]|uniref:hypothetical protein n=1 Tax=Methylocystis sp. MJC1 TaxID=2654282 RepID=UPI0013EAA3E1|nr:hypothetical protein [Methylocystis sp. MJC1]KAF2991150.1 hypothetical protein MJC1_01883 [Methylocystis sp. MJC1]MBU6525927.1 hypothetical protein [Methylocystis sp. MJC1]UZX12393.1 hypothetical protein OGR47_02720 [Methylocystis sp. MJC1]